MKTATTDQPACSIQATLDIVGDRWTLLILRDLFRGVRRFSAMQHDLGIARNMLADRLGRLVDAGVVAKVPYQQRPVRFDYVLTHKGLDLSNSLLALMAWGDRWCQEGDAPTVLVHADCGTQLQLATRCPTCDEPVTPTRIRSRASRSGPSPGGTTAKNKQPRDEQPGGEQPRGEPPDDELRRDALTAAGTFQAFDQHLTNGGAQ